MKTTLALVALLVTAMATATPLRPATDVSPPYSVGESGLVYLASGVIVRVEQPSPEDLQRRLDAVGARHDALQPGRHLVVRISIEGGPAILDARAAELVVDGRPARRLPAEAFRRHGRTPRWSATLLGSDRVATGEGGSNEIWIAFRDPSRRGRAILTGLELEIGGRHQPLAFPFVLD